MIVMVKVITKTIWIKIMRYEFMIMNIDVGDTNTDNYDDDMNDNKNDNRHTDRERERERKKRERKK